MDVALHRRGDGDVGFDRVNDSGASGDAVESMRKRSEDLPCLEGPTQGQGSKPTL
jgi:hypothetical protein